MNNMLTDYELLDKDMMNNIKKCNLDYETKYSLMEALKDYDRGLQLTEELRYFRPMFFFKDWIISFPRPCVSYTQFFLIWKKKYLFSCIVGERFVKFGIYPRLQLDSCECYFEHLHEIFIHYDNELCEELQNVNQEEFDRNFAIEEQARVMMLRVEAKDISNTLIEYSANELDNEMQEEYLIDKGTLRMLIAEHNAYADLFNLELSKLPQNLDESDKESEIGKYSFEDYIKEFKIDKLRK